MGTEARKPKGKGAGKGKGTRSGKGTKSTASGGDVVVRRRIRRGSKGGGDVDRDRRGLSVSRKGGGRERERELRDCDATTPRVAQSPPPLRLPLSGTWSPFRTPRRDPSRRDTPRRESTSRRETPRRDRDKTTDREADGPGQASTTVAPAGGTSTRGSGLLALSLPPLTLPLHLPSLDTSLDHETPPATPHSHTSSSSSPPTITTSSTTPSVSRFVLNKDSTCLGSGSSGFVLFGRPWGYGSLASTGHRRTPSASHTPSPSLTLSASSVKPAAASVGIAVKILRQASAALGSREVRVWRSLGHSEQLPLFFGTGSLTWQGIPTTVIVTEAIVGCSVREVSRRGWTVESVAVLARALALVLAEFRAARWVHRDVKPSNILVEAETGRVLLTDVGLAGRATSDRWAPSVANPSSGLASFVGTVTYMCPQRLTGERVSFATDAWSVGVVLLEAVLRHHPYVPRARSPSTADSSAPPPLRGESDASVAVSGSGDTSDGSTMSYWEVMAEIEDRSSWPRAAWVASLTDMGVDDVTKDLVLGLLRHDPKHRTKPGELLDAPLMQDQEILKVGRQQLGVLAAAVSPLQRSHGCGRTG